MTTTTPSAPDEVVLTADRIAEIRDMKRIDFALEVASIDSDDPGVMRMHSDIQAICAIALKALSPQPAGVTEEQDHEQYLIDSLDLSCDGCGSTDSLKRIRSDGHSVSCCPERKMTPVVPFPSPTDTRERGLEEALRTIANSGGRNGTSGDGHAGAIQIARAALKPTEAPVEDGWVRVPKEEFGRLFATAHELTAYHIVTPETPDNELVHVCNGDLRKLDERVTAFALAASTKEE